MKRCYEFGPDQVAAIDALASKLRIDKTDVLMNGLRLLRVAVRESERGNQVGIVHGERVVLQICGPWVDAEPVPV